MSSIGGESKSNANGDANKNSADEIDEFGEFSNKQKWTRRKLVKAARRNKLQKYNVNGNSKSKLIRSALYTQWLETNEIRKKKRQNEERELVLKEKMKEFKRSPESVQAETGEDSAIIIACQLNNIEIVKKIIKLGADIDIQNKDGMTPIIIAALNGYQELVSYLIQEGADPTIQALNGRNAINAAKVHGHTDIANILRDTGAKSANVDKMNSSKEYICKLKF